MYVRILRDKINFINLSRPKFSELKINSTLEEKLFTLSYNGRNRLKYDIKASCGNRIATISPTIFTLMYTHLLCGSPLHFVGHAYVRRVRAAFFGETHLEIDVKLEHASEFPFMVIKVLRKVKFRRFTGASHQVDDIEYFTQWFVCHLFGDRIRNEWTANL